MANRMTGGEEYASGTRSKKLKSGVAKRVSDRKAFVSEKKASKGITDKQANQRFFVQTRMSEMKAKGKTVTPEMRKQLQQKFQSGDVARKGFAAPKKKAVSSSSTTTTTKPTVAKPTVASRMDSRGNSGFGKGKTRYFNSDITTRAPKSASQYVRRADTEMRGSTNPYNKSQKERGKGYSKSVKPQVTIQPIGMNQSAKLAHTLYGEPTTKHSRLAHAEGARLAAPSGPYIGRNRCTANDDTCEGPKARGTDFCIGHLRNKGQA